MIGGKITAKKISFENYIVVFSAFIKIKFTYLHKIAVKTPIRIAIVD